MNLFILLAFALGGGTIALDHLTHKLPQWLVIILYTGAVILFVVGMLQGRGAGA